MRLESKRVIDFVAESIPVKGCTVSEQIYQDDGGSIFLFSLASGTGISAESYAYHKIITIYGGEMDVFTTSGDEKRLRTGDSLVTELYLPVGMQSNDGCIYTEIGLRKGDTVNEAIKSGEVFRLKDLLPYQEGKILNMDISSNPKMKFVVMSFDEGTGLSEHAAPGEALVFALDGEAIIGYEGKEYPLKAGETFKFDKMGRHAVKALTRFKMALLLVLD